jgi:isocitrate/isopropylmalate dehydrogenase
VANPLASILSAALLLDISFGMKAGSETVTNTVNKLRTARVNEVARLIYTLDAGFSENKKGQKNSLSLLSCDASPNFGID